MDIKKTHRFADLFPTGILVVLGALIASTAIWVALFQYIEHQEADEIATASAANVNLAMAFNEHVLRILKDIEQQSMLLRLEIERKGIRNVDLAAHQDRMRLALPFVRQLNIIDTSGYLAASSWGVPRVYLGDREYFLVHTDQDSSVAHIGRPVIGRVSGKWIIPLSWRLNTASGAFAGVLSISVEPDYFSEFYGKASLEDGIVVLMRSDGTLIARQGRNKVELAADFSHTSAYRMVQSKKAGFYVSSGKIDGVRRLIAFQSLSGYPLSVHVGTSVNEVLAPVRRHWPAYYFAATAITLLLLSGSLLVAWSFVRQKQATRAAVASEEQARRSLEEKDTALLEVREAEEKYRSVIAAMAEGVLIRDTGNTIIACNRSAERILGLDPGQLIGKISVDAGEYPLREDGSPYSAEDRPSALTLRTGVPVANVTMGVHRRDGTIIWLSVSNQPLFHPDATIPYAVVTTFQDITKRKQAENALKDSEARFRTLTELSSDWYWEQDENFRFTSYSDGILARLGVGVDNRIGKTRWEIPTLGITEEQWAAHRADLDAHRTFRNFEMTRVYPDGRVVHSTTSGVPIFDAQGKFKGYRGVGSNITERKQAEQALRESEARFRLLADQAPVLIWGSGTDQLFDYFNAVWLNFTGRTMEQEVGNGWTEGVHPDDLARCVEIYSTAFDRRKPFMMEYRLRRHDGEYRWVRDQGVPRFGAGETFVGYIGSCIDITESKQHTEETIRLNAELERRIEERTHDLQVANRELESFSYSVSHDLRTPLRSIDGFSSLIEKEYAAQLDERGRDYFRRVRAGAARMGSLIDDLLNLSQISRQEMQRVAVDLSALAREIAEELQAGEPGRAVDWVIAEGLQITGDPGLFKIVLQNLIGNAWKYSARCKRPRIEFGVADKDGGRSYFVRDNGAGFDMAYADKLFKAFQRLHSPGDFAGTGIGLATVARIIHRHGGGVWAEGKVNAGAAFYFTL